MNETAEKKSTEPAAKRTNYFLKLRTRKDGEDIKNTVLYDAAILPPGVDEEAVAVALEKKHEQIPGHRPIAAIGSPASTPLGRPAYIITPNGTRLDREKTYGFMLNFTNSGEKELPRLTPILPNDEIIRVLQPSNKGIKFGEIVVTPELLAACTKAQQRGVKRGKNGIPTQSDVMAKSKRLAKKASANQIAEMLGLKQGKEDLWEWLHLKMFFLEQLAAQTVNNLTGGTKAANSDMMFAEDGSFRLVDLLGTKIKIEVKAIESGAHFAEEIHYSIITDQFVIPFVFDARTSVTPSYRNRDYVHGFLETLVNKTKELIINKPKLCHKVLDFSGSSAPTVPKPPTVFFRCDKKRKELESKKEPENKTKQVCAIP